MKLRKGPKNYRNRYGKGKIMKTNSQPGGRRSFHLRENAQLYLIMLPVLLHIFIFSYIPMYGIIIAFQDYFPGKPFFSLTDTNWVGFKHFIEFFNGPYFGRLMRNTFSLSFYFLVFGFWVPILFAVLLNELKSGIFKKYVQTASYLPHFISNVVVAGMVLSFINTDGIINTIVKMFGGTPVAINTEAGYFPPFIRLRAYGNHLAGAVFCIWQPCPLLILIYMKLPRWTEPTALNKSSIFRCHPFVRPSYSCLYSRLAVCFQRTASLFC